MRQLTFIPLPDPDDEPRYNGVDTSRNASEFVHPQVKRTRLSVLQFVLNRHDYGATAEEAGDALGMRPQSVSARCNDLLRLGLIRRSGLKRTHAEKH
jgi:hypothetical protein